MPRFLGREDNAERFERFVRDCVPLLERFVGRLRVRDDDVEDVAQESVARLLRYRDSEPPEEIFGPFGKADRLNWLCSKKRFRNTPSQALIAARS